MAEYLWQSKAGAALTEFSASHPRFLLVRRERKFFYGPHAQDSHSQHLLDIGYFTHPRNPRGWGPVSHTQKSGGATSEPISFYQVLGTMVPSQTGAELPRASVNENNLPPPLFTYESTVPRVLKKCWIWTLPSGNPVVHFQPTLSPGYYNLSPLAFPNLLVKNSF